MVKCLDEICLNSIELQLIGYSLADPSRYVIEIVVFTANTKDGYGERIFEVCKVILFVFLFYSLFCHGPALQLFSQYYQLTIVKAAKIEN